MTTLIETSMTKAISKRMSQSLRLVSWLAITIACLFCNGANAAYQDSFTPWFVDPAGSNTSSGSTSNTTPFLTIASGNYTNATRTFRAPDATDLSTLTVGMWVSIITNGATRTYWVAQITNVNDGEDWFRVSGTAASTLGGTNPGDLTGNDATAIVGGAWKGPGGQGSLTNMFPWMFISNTMTNSDAQRGSFPPCIFMRGDATLASIDYRTVDQVTNSIPGVILVEGYNAFPGDNQIVRWQGDTNGAIFTAYRPWDMSGAGWQWKNLWFSSPGTNAAGSSHTNMFRQSAGGRFERCGWTDAWEIGLEITGAGTYVKDCFFVDNNVNQGSGKAHTSSTVNCTWYRCLMALSQDREGDNGGDGITLTTANTVQQTIDECLIVNNWGVGVSFAGSSYNVRIKNSTIVSNKLSAIQYTSSVGQGITNFSLLEIDGCIIGESPVYGFKGPTGLSTNFHHGPHISNTWFWDNGASDNNITNVLAAFISGTNTFASDPFVARATGNFNLNDTALTLVKNYINYSYPTITNWAGGTRTFMEPGTAQATNGASAASSGGSFTFAQ